MAMLNDPQQVKAAIASFVGPALRNFTEEDLREFRTLVIDQINDELVRRRLAAEKPAQP